MNWRRGFLLAGIHLAVAGTLIVWQESRNWSDLRCQTSSPRTATLRLAAWQEEAPAIEFDPCKMWESVPPQREIVGLGELPAAVVSGWLDECPASWTLAGRLRAGSGRKTGHTELRVLAGLCGLIALQWSLVGGFPLIHPRRWWWEPGAFITLWTLVAFVIVLIPGIRDFASWIMLFALIGWLYWFVLLIWMSGRACWRLVLHRLGHTR